MQVILLDHVKGLGRKGDVKTVKDGYYINFLQPKKLAQVATAQAIKSAEDMKKKEVIVLEKAQEDSKLVQTKLNGQKVTVHAKANGEKLYASITSKEIIEAIFNDFKIRLRDQNFPKKLHLKTVGNHSVELSISDKIKASFQVEVKVQ